MTRFRFSVRTMLIVVAVMAIPLGWVAMRLKTGRDKARAIASLRTMGVSIVMDRNRYQDASPMISPWVRELLGWQSVGIAFGVNSDDALSKLHGMRNLKTLVIGGDVSDSALRYLASMNAIENLTISSPRVTDEGLRRIANSVSLKALNLEGTRVTQAGVLHLTRLQRLEKLTIDGTQLSQADVARLFIAQGRTALDSLVATGQLAFPPNEHEPLELRLKGKQITDELVEYLLQLPSLEAVYLDSTAVTHAGLRRLSSLPTLKRLRLHGESLDHQLPKMPHVISLDLSHSAVSANQLSQHLRSFPQLRSLNLGATTIKNDGLRHLAVLKNLRHLHLGGSNITDQGLTHLSQLPSLRELWLDYTSVSDAGIGYLKELTGLRKLGVVHTRITESGIDELRATLRECEIFGPSIPNLVAPG